MPQFSDDVKKIMQQAREESGRLGHKYVATEHLLLGLNTLKECEGAKTLRDLGTDLDTMHQRILDYMSSTSGKRQKHEDMPITPKAKAALAYAADEAKGMGDEEVNTDHLLLGLLRDKECVAVHHVNNSTSELLPHVAHPTGVIAFPGTLCSDPQLIELPPSQAALNYLVPQSSASFRHQLQHHTRLHVHIKYAVRDRSDCVPRAD